MPTEVVRDDAAHDCIPERKCEVTLRDRDHRVTAVVTLDDAGRPCDFSTTDRFVTDPAQPHGGMIRCRWSTPVERWTIIDGRPLPARAQAIWHLPNGPFPYADFALMPESLCYNVAPGQGIN